MKKSKILLSLVAAAACLAGSASEAQAGKLDFDRDSFFIVSADRTFGFSYAQDKVEQNNTTTTIKSSSLSLLTPSGGSPYNTPQLSLHYSIIPALTIGAGLGITRSSASFEAEGGGQTSTTDSKPVTTILFSPRVGYIFGFSNAFYLWARGGITYFRSGSEDEKTAGTVTVTTKNTNSGVALSLEPMFVFTPVNRVGITFGPVLDYGLTGGTKSEATSGGTTQTTEVDHKLMNVGIQFGLLGYI